MYMQPWNVAALRGPVAAGALADAAGTLAGGPCLQKTGAGTLQLRAGTQVEVGGRLLRFTAAKAVEMPALVAGSDYAVWIAATGAVQASSNFVAAPGAGTWRLVGGFHYAPGGNAPARAGGDTVPAINEYSIWDVKWRPACSDPRGMALVAGLFWADIYLCGVNHHLNGTSKFNVTIADGVSLPKVPLAFGGDGTTAYATCDWWTAGEVLTAYGKRLPSYSEFAALAFGSAEASGAGSDPASTILRAAYTSRWGVMLATGNMWTWGLPQGGGQGAAAYTANTGGRGSTYLLPNAVLFGGNWNNGANCGSRASIWNNSPANSNVNIGVRGVCDHLRLA